MAMNLDTATSLDTTAFDEDAVTNSDLVGYWKPREILDDPSITVARKRELLAFWASDIHAVAGAPALRCARGVTVHIDELLDALKELDSMVDVGAIPKPGFGRLASG
jgi:hypothetical protein